MEYIHPECLTRTQVINALHERKLHLPNEQDLPAEALIHTYKKFIMPLAKRQHNRRHIPYNGKHKCDEATITTATTTPSCTLLDNHETMEVDIKTEELPTLERLYVNRIYEEESIATVCVKRPFGCSIEDHISSATKRIKINWN